MAKAKKDKSKGKGKDKKGKDKGKKVKKGKKKAQKAAKASRTVSTPARTEVPRKQPETLRLRSTIPALVVGNLAASIAFYTDGLGFVVAEEMRGADSQLEGVQLRAGRTLLLLAQDDFLKGRDRNKGEGFRVYCVTKQPVDALAERARTKGIQLSEEVKDQPWGARDFTVTDPDGFRLSFSNWESGA